MIDSHWSHVIHENHSPYPYCIYFQVCHTDLNKRAHSHYNIPLQWIGLRGIIISLLWSFVWKERGPLSADGSNVFVEYNTPFLCFLMLCMNGVRDLSPRQQGKPGAWFRLCSFNVARWISITGNYFMKKNKKTRYNRPAISINKKNMKIAVVVTCTADSEVYINIRLGA